MRKSGERQEQRYQKKFWKPNEEDNSNRDIIQLNVRHRLVERHSLIWNICLSFESSLLPLFSLFAVKTSKKNRMYMSTHHIAQLVVLIINWCIHRVNVQYSRVLHKVLRVFAFHPIRQKKSSLLSRRLSKHSIASNTTYHMLDILPST